MAQQIELTPELRRRVQQSIDECSRLIDREEARNPALRPASAQKLLEFHITHRSRLIASLGANRVEAE